MLVLSNQVTTCAELYNYIDIVSVFQITYTAQHADGLTVMRGPAPVKPGLCYLDSRGKAAKPAPTVPPLIPRRRRRPQVERTAPSSDMSKPWKLRTA